MGRPRLAILAAAASRFLSPKASRAASAAVRRSALEGAASMVETAKVQRPKLKCEAADAVEALDPGVPYESRWAPYVRAHGPGQGQFPKGSIRPRGYMAPDARRSFARINVATIWPDRQRPRPPIPCPW